MWMLRSCSPTIQAGSLLGLPNWLNVCPAGGVLLPQVQPSVYENCRHCCYSAWT